MNNANDTASVDDFPGQPSVRDAALGCAATLGHFDELRGGASHTLHVGVTVEPVETPQQPDQSGDEGQTPARNQGQFHS